MIHGDRVSLHARGSSGLQPSLDIRDWAVMFGPDMHASSALACDRHIEMGWWTGRLAPIKPAGPQSLAHWDGVSTETRSLTAGVANA